MRSRYCAYAMGLVDYIIATTHRENPNYRAETDAWKDDLDQFSQGTNFRALEIKDFVDGEDKAYVTFRATLRQGEHDVSFTEKSTFVKEDGRWMYRSGEIE
jgi:SEC-C motif domain protein